LRLRRWRRTQRECCTQENRQQTVFALHRHLPES
jgi:hypothetical protein